MLVDTSFHDSQRSLSVHFEVVDDVLCRVIKRQLQTKRGDRDTLCDVSLPQFEQPLRGTLPRELRRLLVGPAVAKIAECPRLSRPNASVSRSVGALKYLTHFCSLSGESRHDDRND